jgi:hypothetical protein
MDLYSASSLEQQSVSWCVTPLTHYPDSESTSLCSFSLVEKQQMPIWQLSQQLPRWMIEDSMKSSIILNCFVIPVLVVRILLYLQEQLFECKNVCMYVAFQGFSIHTLSKFKRFSSSYMWGLVFYSKKHLHDCIISQRRGVGL